MERGGKSIEKHLVNVNPTGSDECGDAKCPFCAQPGGAGGAKVCRKNKILYEAKCLKCPDSKYVGESDRNLFTRGREHQLNKSGFIAKHQAEKHNSEPAEFEWKVLRTFRDPLSRHQEAPGGAPELEIRVPSAAALASEERSREGDCVV